MTSLAIDPSTHANPLGPDHCDRAADRVGQVLAALRAGRPAIVADDPGRENEIDFVLPAGTATEEQVALLVRHGTGLICAAIPAARAGVLDLPQQVPTNANAHRTAYTVLCDARWPDDGTAHTGISAGDRAATLRVLADPASTSADLIRPGHVAPLAAQPGGVLARAGHTEAGVDLAERAGVAPAAAIVEIQHDNGRMVRLPEWQAFRRRHRLPDFPVATVADLIQYRRLREVQVRQVAAARLPIRWGTAEVSVWADTITGEHHVALVIGDTTGPQPVLTRVHSECLTGDLLGSLRCDCGAQLDAALARIGAEGRGVLVYLGGHEGRGIGLANKIAAYALQDAGANTVEANQRLGLPVDGRRYHAAGQILTTLGIRRIRLMTNNPAKVSDVRGHVEVVSREPLRIAVSPFNEAYLWAKARLLGHDLLLGGPQAPVVSAGDTD